MLLFIVQFKSKCLADSTSSQLPKDSWACFINWWVFVLVWNFYRSILDWFATSLNLIPAHFYLCFGVILNRFKTSCEPETCTLLTLPAPKFGDDIIFNFFESSRIFWGWGLCLQRFSGPTHIVKQLLLSCRNRWGWGWTIVNNRTWYRGWSKQEFELMNERNNCTANNKLNGVCRESGVK